MDKIPMTARGVALLEDELRQLKNVERQAVIKAIADARALGDLSENAEYHAAREKQGFIEGRIAELESKINHAYVIDVSKLTGDIVRFGAHVLLEEEDADAKIRYQIVGEDEADIKNGFLSIAAPLARGLIGKKVGDEVEIRTPGGLKTYYILEVDYR